MKRTKRKKKVQRTTETLRLDDALALAVKLHRSGRLDEADAIYRKVLQAQPRDPNALHFLGVLTHQKGNSSEAIDLIRRSLEASPEHPDAHCNLGNVLKELGRYEEAEQSYQKAVRLNPEHANAYSNLGTVHHALRRNEEAVVAYRKAIAINPEHSDAYLNLGNVLKQSGQFDAAIDAYRQAVSLQRYSGEAYRNLGAALYVAGRTKEASEVYEKWLRELPDDPVALHMLAACSGQNVPDRASDDYVRSYFDGFAASFDANLSGLAYRAPQLVMAMIRDNSPEPTASDDVLDAGCGTGLCGPLLRPYAARLVGVDLSAMMLEKARLRGSYNELVQAELTEYLNRSPDSYDLVASADTLPYFGDLAPPLRATAVSLRSGGRLAFSLEHTTGRECEGSFRLEPHGRYSHGEAYVRQVLDTAGFRVTDLRHDTLRTEAGQPVAGLVVLAEVAS